MSALETYMLLYIRKNHTFLHIGTKQVMKVRERDLGSLFEAERVSRLWQKGRVRRDLMLVRS